MDGHAELATRLDGVVAEAAAVGVERSDVQTLMRDGIEEGRSSNALGLIGGSECDGADDTG